MSFKYLVLLFISSIEDDDIQVCLFAGKGIYIDIGFRAILDIAYTTGGRGEYQ